MTVKHGMYGLTI